MSADFDKIDNEQSSTNFGIRSTRLDTAYKTAYVINTVVSYALVAAAIGAAAFHVLKNRKDSTPEDVTITDDSTAYPR